MSEWFWRRCVQTMSVTTMPAEGCIFLWKLELELEPPLVRGPAAQLTMSRRVTAWTHRVFEGVL